MIPTNFLLKFFRTDESKGNCSRKTKKTKWVVRLLLLLDSFFVLVREYLFEDLVLRDYLVVLGFHSSRREYSVQALLSDSPEKSRSVCFLVVRSTRVLGLVKEDHGPVNRLPLYE